MPASNLEPLNNNSLPKCSEKPLKPMQKANNMCHIATMGRGAIFLETYRFESEPSDVCTRAPILKVKGEHYG